MVFLNLAVFAVMITFIGRWYDRHGAKPVLLCATLFLAFGYIGISQINALWQFGILYGVFLALGLGGTSGHLFAALNSKWFYSNRGAALSIALSGGCLGQYALAPLATHMVLTFGWRWTFAAIGLCILVVNLALIFTLIKEKPAVLGLQPFGRITADRTDNARANSQEADQGLKLKEAMRTSPFWLYLVIMSVCGGGNFLVLLHLVPMVTDYGISAESAGDMLGWYGLLSLVGVLIVGRTIDKIGNKTPVFLTVFVRCLLFLFILKYHTVAAFYIFALAFGFTMLIVGPITTTLIIKLYGFAHMGLISGLFTTVHHISGGLWAFLAGALFDVYGNYRLIFIAYAVASLIAAGCALLIREKRYFSSGETAGF